MNVVKMSEEIIGASKTLAASAAYGSNLVDLGI